MKVPELPDRVAVLLAEIETVREIVALSEESALTQELKGFVASLARSLRTSLPSLSEWPAPEINERCIYFCPGKSWKVVPSRSSRLRDHSVALIIELGTIVDADPLWSDAWVGIRVPEKWRKAADFEVLLRMIKLKGFKALVDVEDREEYDQCVPLWSDIQYTQFAKRGAFDGRGFVNAICERLRVLVGATKRIEATIEKARGRHPAAA